MPIFKYVRAIELRPVLLRSGYGFLADNLLELRGLWYACLLPLNFAFLEQNQRRDAADAISGSSLLIAVHINFDDGELVAEGFFLTLSRMGGIMRQGPHQSA